MAMTLNTVNTMNVCTHGYILYHMCWKKGGQKYTTKVFADWTLREFKLCCLGSLGYTASTELNYHDYLVETSLVTGTMATRWAREQLRQTVASPCTGSASILAREAGQGLFVLFRYPQTGAGNCQAPARGRATISLTIGNGHHWQLRANNGFRFKFKYHVINCQRAWQVVSTICSCI